MSQDPTRPGTPAPLTAQDEQASNEPPGTQPTRRAFLQYAGIGFASAAVTGLPGCAVDAGPAVPGQPAMTAADEAALVAAAAWFDVRRRDDLLSFRLGVVNLLLTSTARSGQPGIPLAGQWYLKRGTTDQAYLIVQFQPQTIFEQAFEEQGNPKPVGGRTPVNARMAQPSRLVFLVPASVQAIPFELDKLLTAIEAYQLNVAANALPQFPSAPIIVPIFGQAIAAPASALQAPATRMRARSRQTLFAKMNPEASTSAQLNAVTANGRTSAALLPGPILLPPPVVNPGPPVVNPGPPIVLPPPPPTYPVAPGPLETSLELPYRLQISPNAYAQWSHATTAEPIGAAKRVELWHTRLGTPQGWQKTIRALWASDLAFNPKQPIPTSPKYDDIVNPSPFLGSLTDKDRGGIVHCSSNYTLKDTNGHPRAAAVPTNALMLSTLGGWLDAHGTWAIPDGAGPDLVAWDHVAGMGRDHYVRAVHFGYLFPYGHKAVLVEVGQRKFLDPSYGDTAYIWRRNYVIVKDPLKTYGGLSPTLARGFPFTSLRFKTTVTPDLLPFNDPSATIAGGNFPSSGWCALTGGTAFQFKVEAFDKEGNVHDFNTSCIFISHDDIANVAGAQASNYAHNPDIAATWTAANPSYTDATPRSQCDLRSQRVSYADAVKPDDTRYTTASLVPTAYWYPTFQNDTPFVPQLHHATLDIDTIRGITGSQQPQPFSYHAAYLANGFDGGQPNAQNTGEIVLGFGYPNVQNATKPALDLSKSTSKSGGFVAPTLNVGGLSRKQGIVGGDAADFAKGQSFDPGKFFDSLGANLFGCVPISGIINAFDPDFFKQAPKWLTQGMQTIETIVQMATDIASSDDAATTLTSQLVDQLNALIAAANALPPGGGLASLPAGSVAAMLYPRVASKAGKVGMTGQQFAQQAQAFLTDLTDATTGLIPAVTKVTTQLDAIIADPSISVQPFVDAVNTTATALTKLAAGLGDLKSNPIPIDAGIRQAIVSAAQGFGKALAAINLLPGGLKGLATSFAMAEDAIENLHIKLDWGPTLAPWPNKSAALFWPNDVNGFHVGVEIRGKAQDGMEAGADVYASLVDFNLQLLGSDPFIILHFEHLIFKAGTSTKPDIDCVFDGIEFAGPLSFVNTLKQFIPLDGFSDPPNVQVTKEGLVAQLGLPLPNIACGMFSLENLSINAGFNIPFIGKSLSVSFSFCTRESPFVLTVCMLGGGGFVGITLTPQGVQSLELSLEATACLAVDFGVASGSISISVGVYLCIENGDCKLSGFVKLHGEVSVLEIISASLDLDLELSYESKTGKVIGEASLEISVSILCFSVSVSVHVQKKFKGGNNDPSFRQMMSGDQTFSNPWADYVQAFQPVAA